MHNFIFYRGPSAIDGSPIVGIATLASGNRKTGDMVQTWIIREDVHPVEASRTGADKAICGDCTHRGQYDDNGRVEGTRTCYVMLFPVASIFTTLKRGAYEDMTADLHGAATRLSGRIVRMGSYGDPAAIPHNVWTQLISSAKAHTGYTHQWRLFPEFADLVMASCDSSEDRVAAKVLGFRTFRVTNAGDWTKEAGEVLCPASEEAGKKTTCQECRACGGTSAKARCDIVIPAHGTAKRRVRG